MRGAFDAQGANNRCAPWQPPGELRCAETRLPERRTSSIWGPTFLQPFFSGKSFWLCAARPSLFWRRLAASLASRAALVGSIKRRGKARGGGGNLSAASEEAASWGWIGLPQRPAALAGSKRAAVLTWGAGIHLHRRGSGDLAASFALLALSRSPELGSRSVQCWVPGPHTTFIGPFTLAPLPGPRTSSNGVRVGAARGPARAISRGWGP